MDISVDERLKSFRFWIKLTLLFVFLVICAGAIVRATGSGMGCPDWPRCFGSWIPPTSLDDLPPDYREKYATNEIEVQEFNVYKTWTEYLNRLFGALLGIVAIVALFKSFMLGKTHRILFWLSLFILLLIGFEGWLGKTVVDSNLSPLKITLHMVTALIIMCLCLLTLFRAKQSAREVKANGFDRILVMISVVCTLVQIILGTQIREEIDIITNAPGEIAKETWVGMLSTVFPVHRTFSILVLVLNLIVWYKLRASPIRDAAVSALILVAAEAIVGIIIASAHFPAGSQPAHLVLATLLFAVQAWILVRIFPVKHHFGTA